MANYKIQTATDTYHSPSWMTAYRCHHEGKSYHVEWCEVIDHLEWGTVVRLSDGSEEVVHCTTWRGARVGEQYPLARVDGWLTPGPIHAAMEREAIARADYRALRA